MTLYREGRVCSFCGKHLDSSDSFSVMFRDDGDVVKCTGCDEDFKE